MVDPIGPKPAKPSDRVVAPVLRATSAPPPSGREPQGTESSAIRTMAQDMAARPPVDAERVAKLRRAIAQGEFPIEPAAIADRMVTFKHLWVSHDEA